VVATIHCSYFDVDSLQNAYIIDYARNDGIISRSLIRLVYDNELLVKTGDMFDPFVLLKGTCLCSPSLSFFAPKCVEGNSMKKLPKGLESGELT